MLLPEHWLGWAAAAGWHWATGTTHLVQQKPSKAASRKGLHLHAPATSHLLLLASLKTPKTRKSLQERASLVSKHLCPLVFVLPHSHINIFEFGGVPRKERYVLESRDAEVAILVVTHARYPLDVGSTCCE